MKTQTSLETFINRFAFNKDADIQYLLHGLTSKRPYIEQLRISITTLIKSQKLYKKNLTTIKVKTDKNAKKFSESFDNLEMDFLRMVDLLKDTHHFFINILKIDIYTQQNFSYEDMYKRFSELNPNFTDLVQQIDFDKQEKFILNTFNRMRNIIIHAPSGIIIGYLTESVLEEFRSVVNLSIGIANNILTRNLNSIRSIIDLQQKEIEKTDNLGVEDARSFATRYNLTLNELLDIIRNSDYDFVVEIHQDMLLDAYAKSAIIPDIEAKVNQKIKHNEELKLHNYVSQLHKSNTHLVVDFDYVLKQFSNDINKTYNHIYELFENLKINKISIISISASKEVKQIIKELLFTTKSKQSIDEVILDDCNKLSEYMSSCNKSSTIVAYVNDEIQTCLEEYKQKKYIIVYDSNCILNIELDKWNVIEIKNSNIVKIRCK